MNDPLIVDGLTFDEAVAQELAKPLTVEHVTVHSEVHGVCQHISTVDGLITMNDAQIGAWFRRFITGSLESAKTDDRIESAIRRRVAVDRSKQRHPCAAPITKEEEAP